MYIGTGVRPVLVQKGCLAFQTEAIPLETEPTEPIETEPPVKTSTPQRPTPAKTKPQPQPEVATPGNVNNNNPGVSTPKQGSTPGQHGVTPGQHGVTPGRHGVTPGKLDIKHVQELTQNGENGGVVVGDARGDIPENDIILESWNWSHDPPNFYMGHGK